MSFVDTKLVQWLKELSTDIVEHLEPYSKLMLYHASDGSPDGTLLREIVLSEGMLENPEFAQGIWNVAEAEVATNMGQVQRFVVLAFRGESDQYTNRFAFLLNRRTSAGSAMGGDSTPPTETGLTMQMLRHDTDAHRMIMLLAGATAERQELELQRKTQQITALEDRHQRTLLLQEDLLDRKSERELRHGIEQHKAKRLDQAAGMVLSFLPLLFAGLTGGKNVGGSAVASNARDTAVGNILKNLTKEEFFGIFNNLKGENQVLFMELYKSYRTENEKAEAEKPQVLRDDDGAPN